MTLALERIRTLRQQSGQATPTRAPPAPVPSSAAPRPAAQTVEDLRRLLRVRAPTRIAHAIDTDRTLPGDEIAPGLRLIDTTLPYDPLPQTLCGAFDRRVAMIPTDNVLFFDTETTGLAGGTGTRAFMIGIAQWRDDALHLRQWLMTTLGAERDLLTAFADTLRTDTVLASYNGKSYDAPLLATRFRLARLPNPLAGLDHIDLLYPTRRRYKGRWENCRLATIERLVLGVVREDDVPGSEAPAAWLSYLRGGSARNLRRVADHNRQDLASLGGLLVHHASVDADAVFS
ncbi:MAG: ribonuclease H-like domain-containing protein [Lysobacteraceae bacterium]